MNLFSWLSSLHARDHEEIRGEIWRLGTRHRGQPLDGALRELEAPDLTASRARLLRACIRKLQRQ